MGFAGKRFPFWPPLPLPAASISVALAPIFTLPNSKKHLEWAQFLDQQKYFKANEFSTCDINSNRIILSLTVKL